MISEFSEDIKIFSDSVLIAAAGGEVVLSSTLNNWLIPSSDLKIVAIKASAIYTPAGGGATNIPGGLFSLDAGNNYRLNNFAAGFDSALLVPASKNRQIQFHYTPGDTYFPCEIFIPASTPINLIVQANLLAAAIAADSVRIYYQVHYRIKKSS